MIDVSEGAVPAHGVPARRLPVTVMSGFSGADGEARRQIEADWCEPWGDRRQELVFIGVDLDEAGLRARLDIALLTDEEWGQGPSQWAKLDNRFPPWIED